MHLINISIGTKDSFLLNRAADQVRSEGLPLEYRNYDSSDLDSDPRLLAEALGDVRSADLVTLKVHGDTSYMKRFDRLLGAIESEGTCALLQCTDECVSEDFRRLFDGDDEDYRAALTYYTLAGDSNFRSLLLWALRRFDGLEVDVPEPVRPPAQGVYIPGMEDTSFETYLDSLDPSRPKVGIFFYQKQWLTGNLGNIDGLIDAVRELGGIPVPVFLQTYEDPLVGAIGVKRILREHLTQDGEPVLDAIIETMSFSQTLVATPGCGEQVSEENFFLSYGVPVLQAMTTSSGLEQWLADVNGLSPSEVAYDVAHPEFDGQIITVPAGTTERVGGTREYASVPDRARRVADTALMWARLRWKANPERRVAVLLYMYPPRTANAGGAAGLDTFASVVDLLHRMRDDGYDVGDAIPETPRELVDALLSGLTNDIDWLSDEEVARRSLDVLSAEDYGGYYAELSQAARGRIREGWGDPPGDFYTTRGGLMIPGVLYGNVLVGFQPDRGRDIQGSYHDPDTVMPHQYLAYYRWLRRVFGADAVVHVGTHGTLEWLPGKSVALSGDCCPDYVLDSLPDVYPYIIGNPGEGIQAKRRGSAVIVDHMIPTMARAGGYDDILELEGAIQKFMDAGTQGQAEARSMILAKLREIVSRMELYSDMKLDPGCSDDEFAEAVDGLYDYVVDVKGNLIKDGLHILGRPPEGELMCETVYSLTRLDNGDVPSLRASVASCMGLDIQELLDDPAGRDPASGRLNGELLEDAEEATYGLIRRMESLGFDPDACLGAARDMLGTSSEDLERVLGFICGTLRPNLMAMGREIDGVMDALRGRFIEPGPAGCPTRGRAQLLPTGRNFYSLDPDSIPWHSSWDIGRRMADQMLERYVSEHGTYPRTVGIVVWATDTMKTGGDDIAYILWLMGLRPVWTGYAGRVRDIEVIPVGELGRPRVDVTLRISGLFRDTFPNLVNFIDRGVRMIADLDESDEENYLAANLRADVARAIAEGIPEDRAREEASVRIFGDAPGTYGSGTNILIRTSDWRDVGDLGAIYRSYGQYAYGLGRKGTAMPEAFRRRLEVMEVTVKNSVSREYDLFDNDDVYTDLGGFNAAVRSVRGEMPMSVIGCSADPENLRSRTVDEEGRFVFRSKVNNPKWLEGLKRHGFKGAQEISNMAEYVFAWDATSDSIDPWMYQSIADRFLFDDGTAEWFEDVNPHAMHDTAARLLEAIGRGMWEPDEGTRRRLERIYMDLEERFEGMERCPRHAHRSVVGARRPAADAVGGRGRARTVTGARYGGHRLDGGGMRRRGGCGGQRALPRQALRRPRSGRRHRPGHPPRGDLRVPRAERCREDHNHPHADHPHRPYGGPRGDRGQEGLRALRPDQGRDRHRAAAHSARPRRHRYGEHQVPCDPSQDPTGRGGPAHPRAGLDDGP